MKSRGSDVAGYGDPKTEDTLSEEADHVVGVCATWATF